MPIKKISKASCPVCRTEVDRISWTYKGSDIFICRRCDLEFVWPFVAGDLAYYAGHEAYRALHRRIETEGVPPGNHAISLQIERILKSYFRQAPHALRMLDYGCGAGFYAAHFKRLGYEVMGVDFNPDMIRIAQEVFGVNADHRSAAELLEASESFDFILLNQVIEHVADPVDLLAMLVKLLKKGGLIFVSAPNRHFIRAQKKLKQGLLPDVNYPPHHISFWSVDSLHAALQAAGVKVLDCFEQTYPEPIQTEASLCARFKKPRGAFRWITGVAVFVGRLLNLPGVNLFAVGAADE